MRRLLAFLVLCAACALPAAADEPADARYRAQIHTELGAGYFSRGQLGVALEELSEAVKADSDYAPAYTMLGLVYMELREHDQAEENFRRALGLEPANSEAHNNYGWFLCQRERTDEAIPHFLAALKNPLYTTPEKPYFNAGVCSLKKGDEKGAEEFFLKAARFQAAPPQTLWHLADINFRRGDYAAAKQYLERFLQSSQPTAEALWLGARLERRLGNRDAEANYSLQLRKKFPDSREAMLLRDGQYDDAGGRK